MKAHITRKHPEDAKKLKKRISHVSKQPRSPNAAEKQAASSSEIIVISEKPASPRSISKKIIIDLNDIDDVGDISFSPSKTPPAQEATPFPIKIDDSLSVLDLGTFLKLVN